MITVPAIATKIWRQLNRGYSFGELWATFNIDLISERGKVKISPRTYRNFDSSDDVDFSYPAAMIRSDADTTDRWWIQAGTVLFKSATLVPTSAYAQDAIADTPACNYLQSDMVNFEGSLIVSLVDDIAKMTAGTWTASWWKTTLAQAALTASEIALGNFNRLLIIGNRNLVHTVDRNSVVNNTRLTLPPEFYITRIRTGVDKIWFSTRNVRGGEALVFEWDGYSTSYNRWYPVRASECWSMEIKDNVPYIITSSGLLLRFNGAGFGEIARLPIFDTRVYDDVTNRLGATWGDYLGFGSGSNVVSRFGMAVIDDRIHILMRGKVTGDENQLLENMMSGIWCFDEEFGLFNRFALSQYKAAATIVDYGMGVLVHAGGLIATDKNTGLFLAGGAYYSSNASTEVKALFINDTSDTISKRGYIILSRFFAASIQSMWDHVWLQFGKMRAATDSFIIKKRQTKDFALGFEANMVWVNTTTLTSTNANFANAVAGDELEFVRGQGAGTTVHISSINVLAGTYTIVIDEAVPNMTTSTARAYVREWVKLGSIVDSALTGKLGTASSITMV